MMQMSEILGCNVSQCAYNRDNKCHAMAINVGGTSPLCDAFTETVAKCGDTQINGSVGSCKLKDCRFNDCLMCTATGIRVKWDNNQAMCETFAPR